MTNHRLNDIQIVLLASACQREDGSLMPLPDPIASETDRARTSIRALLRKKLIEEIPATTADRIWREDGDTRFGIAITEAGRSAINANEEPPAKPVRTSRKKSDASAPAAGAPRVTKRAQLVSLLERDGGASLAEMAETTGWLPHTTRASMTGLRKSGMTIDSELVDKERRYRIVSAKA